MKYLREKSVLLSTLVTYAAVLYMIMASATSRRPETNKPFVIIPTFQETGEY